MNFGSTMKMAKMWKEFQGEHPMFCRFLNAVKTEGMREGTILEVVVTTPEGKKMTSNIKVSRKDMELFQNLGNLK
ncbi:hypothetical protein lbkm_0486 [Lachnospiraceae bacterium KM106-2]|nr:hypothetical protein lbkm_0486 [Lachnospiraceae bacterium KM106-2]